MNSMQDALKATGKISSEKVEPVHQRIAGVVRRDRMWLYWCAERDTPITRNEAENMQIEGGFHPNGYSFDAFACTKLEGGGYRATWKCYASCD